MSIGPRIPPVSVAQGNTAAMPALVTQRFAEYEQIITRKNQLLGQLENRVVLLTTEAKLNHEHHTKAVGYLENTAAAMTLWKDECNQREAQLKLENTELRDALKNCRGQQQLAINTCMATVSQLEMKIDELINELRLTSAASSVIID